MLLDVVAEQVLIDLFVARVAYALNQGHPREVIGKLCQELGQFKQPYRISDYQTFKSIRNYIDQKLGEAPFATIADGTTYLYSIASISKVQDRIDITDTAVYQMLSADPTINLTDWIPLTAIRHNELGGRDRDGYVRLTWWTDLSLDTFNLHDAVRAVGICETTRYPIIMRIDSSSFTNQRLRIPRETEAFTNWLFYPVCLHHPTSTGLAYDLRRMPFEAITPEIIGLSIPSAFVKFKIICEGSNSVLDDPQQIISEIIPQLESQIISSSNQ